MRRNLDHSGGQVRRRDPEIRSRRLRRSVRLAQRLKVIDRIEELEENVIDEVVSAKIMSLLKNFALQITIKTEIHGESQRVR